MPAYVHVYVPVYEHALRRRNAVLTIRASAKANAGNAVPANPIPALQPAHPPVLL